MDAREMLNLPTKYKHIINMRITNAHEMYVQLTSPSMHYGDRIGSPGSRNNTGFVSGLDRIDAYNEETEKLKAEYVAVNHKIENCIFHLENLMEQQILTDLFLHFKTQRETAAKYNYSQRQIQRIRDAGIEHLDEILKKHPHMTDFDTLKKMSGNVVQCRLIFVLICGKMILSKIIHNRWIKPAVIFIP